MISPIRTNPATHESTAVIIMGTLVSSIRSADPTSMVRAETIVLMLWFIDWPMVSTSLVTRLITSPVVFLSKYFRGRRLIFLEMSSRRLDAVLCDTVERMYPSRNIRTAPMPTTIARVIP